MPRKLAIPPESFDEILAWLSSDRDVAGDMYVQLHHDLSKLFQWRGCHDAEALTDEVFDRVARKVHEVRPTYVGDPRNYFRAVANNVIKESLKKFKTQVSLEGIDPPKQHETAGNDDTANMEECLETCLQRLSTQQRELILAYYAKEKQGKIDHRNRLAQSSGITVEALRVKVHRIRVTLERCIERCLKTRVQPK